MAQFLFKKARVRFGTTTRIILSEIEEDYEPFQNLEDAALHNYNTPDVDKSSDHRDSDSDDDDDDDDLCDDEVVENNHDTNDKNNPTQEYPATLTQPLSFSQQARSNAANVPSRFFKCINHQ